MNSRDLLLAIDNGTQSMKALVFDGKGHLAAKHMVPFDPPYFSQHPGWAEQHAHIFWQALCQACRGLWDAEGVNKDRIAGVAVTTQRSTLFNMDKNGTPLRPAIHWLDQRKTHGQNPLGGLWGLLFKLVRMGDTIAYFQAEAEANWLRTYQPDIWRDTYKFLFLSGYLTYKLTGDFCDSIGCQVG